MWSIRGIHFDRNFSIHISCCESCTKHKKREIPRLSKSGTFSRFFFILSLTFILSSSFFSSLKFARHLLFCSAGVKGRALCSRREGFTCGCGVEGLRVGKGMDCLQLGEVGKGKGEGTAKVDCNSHRDCDVMEEEVLDCCWVVWPLSFGNVP